jgi:hypothetical protein
MAEQCKKVGLRERLGGVGKRFDNPRSSNFTPGPGYYSYNDTSSPKQSTFVFRSKTRRDLNEAPQEEMGKYYDCGYNDIGNKGRRGGGQVLFKFLSVEDNKKPAFQSLAPRFTKKGNGLPGPCYYNVIPKGSLNKPTKRFEAISKSYNRHRKDIYRYLHKH